MDVVPKIVFIINNVRVVIEDSFEKIHYLQTDDMYTLEYIQQLLTEGELAKLGIKAQTVSDLTIVREEGFHNKKTPNLTPPNSSKEVLDSSRPSFDAIPANAESSAIWSQRGKQTEADQKATEYMLQLRMSPEFEKKFNDKHTTKINLWQAIAERMAEKGYFVGVNKVGAEKCQQKFNNLQKAYSKFITHTKQTGVEKKDPPEHFALMHAILGGKDKIFPKALMDSMTPTEEPVAAEAGPFETLEEPSFADVSEDPLALDEPGDQQVSQALEHPIVQTPSRNETLRSNRFAAVNKTTKPKKDKESVIDVLKDMHKENMAQNNQQADALVQALTEQNVLLKEQNEQRGKLLELFAVVAKTPNNCSCRRKRRHSSDSD